MILASWSPTNTNAHESLRSGTERRVLTHNDGDEIYINESDVNELAQAKGGKLPDIGLLSSGEFYAAGEGFALVKVKTPMCLTHHPKAPLSPEEVIERARG